VPHSFAHDGLLSIGLGKLCLFTQQPALGDHNGGLGSLHKQAPDRTLPTCHTLCWRSQVLPTGHNHDSTDSCTWLFGSLKCHVPVSSFSQCWGQGLCTQNPLAQSHRTWSSMHRTDITEMFASAAREAEPRTRTLTSARSPGMGRVGITSMDGCAELNLPSICHVFSEKLLESPRGTRPHCVEACSCCAPGLCHRQRVMCRVEYRVHEALDHTSSAHKAGV